MELRTTSRRIVLSVLALVFVITLSYAPAFRAGFIWDDDDHLTHNPAVASSAASFSSNSTSSTTHLELSGKTSR